jgi:hypothetical protein
MNVRIYKDLLTKLKTFKVLILTIDLRFVWQPNCGHIITNFLDKQIKLYILLYQKKNYIYIYIY